MSKFNLGLTHSYIEDDGRIEVVDFDDIDIALGNKVSVVINKLHVSDPQSKRNSRLHAFTTRKTEDKVAMGEFESPRRFLLALSKQGKDKIQLPCIYITRDPNWVYAEPDKYKDVTGIGQITDGDTYIGAVDSSSVALSYQINVVGWQNDNINAISMLITQWLRHQRTELNFDYKTRIAGANVELAINVTDGKLVTVDSASLPFEEDKLRVLAMTITVDAEVISVRYGNKVKARIIVTGDQYE